MNSNPQLLRVFGQKPTRIQDERKPIHVLTLTPFYPSEDDDAGGCFVAEPLEALAGTGVVNTVLAVQPIYRGRLRARTASVPVEWLHYFSFPGGFGLPTAGAFLFARLVGQVRTLKHKQQVDLIHAHGALPCGHAAMLLSTELGIPYVVSVHGLDAFSTEQVGGRAGQWCRRISQRVYRSSRRVICVSEHVREVVLEGVGRAARTSVVYNAVDPEMFSPGSENECGTTASDTQIVLSVGNLIPIKGHALLIRAVALLVGDFPALSLEIIGDGLEGSRLQTLAHELDISDRVRFLGRRPRREVAAAMRRCMIFALPSRYEGLGCVYLEAMATGKPAIGCRGQGIAEIIQHGANGLLVGPENEKELALALALLLRDQALRRNLGRAARDTVLERYTLAQQAEILERIYRESAA